MTRSQSLDVSLDPRQPELPRRSHSLTRPRLIGLALGGVALVALLGLLGWALWGQPGTVGESKIKPRPAPTFALTGFDGKPVNLADLKGRPVVVNFWASWCGPCRVEAQALEDGWQRYKDQGVVFVGIAVQDQDKDSRVFISEFRVSYPNAPDPGGKTSIDYGMTGVPETYFISRDGQIVRKFAGPLTPERLDAYIAELTR